MSINDLCLTLSAMHRTFQRDLYLLRLNTLREYAKSLDNSMNPISSDPTEPLKLNAQVNVWQMPLKLNDQVNVWQLILKLNAKVNMWQISF